MRLAWYCDTVQVMTYYDRDYLADVAGDELSATIAELEQAREDEDEEAIERLEREADAWSRDVHKLNASW